MDFTSLWHGDREKNKISISFDDGPNPYWTNTILDILSDYNSKAIFFVLGKYAEKYPEIIHRIIKDGHLIGNHSYSHLDLGGYTDFEKCEEVLLRIIGKNSVYIRPPYNKTKWCHRFDLVLNKKVSIINNDVVTRDWNSSSEDIYSRALSKTDNGSIILFHDGSEKEGELKNRPHNMVEVLPRIIEELSGKYEIVRLDELLS